MSQEHGVLRVQAAEAQSQLVKAQKEKNKLVEEMRLQKTSIENEKREYKQDLDKLRAQVRSTVTDRNNRVCFAGISIHPDA